MAKLSDRQKTNLKAKWDTGEYTKTELAKAYKISDVMVGKIVGLEKPKNVDFVEAQLVLEKAKKLEKSSAEISAIDNAVKHRLEKEFNADSKRIKIYDVSNKLLDRIQESLNKNTKQMVLKVKEYNPDGGIIESLDKIDIELNTSDYKNIADSVDKISITQNVNDRHSPKGDITVQTTNQTFTSIDIANASPKEITNAYLDMIKS